MSKRACKDQSVQHHTQSTNNLQVWILTGPRIKGFLQKLREKGNNRVPVERKVQSSLRCEEGLLSLSVMNSFMNKGNGINAIHILL